MRSELVIPLQLSGVGIECNHAAGVEIVAAPHIAIHVGTRIAGAPEDQVQFGIIRSRDPGRCSSALP